MTLDPLALPLVTQVVPSQQSDDPLYVPAIRQAQAWLVTRGVTHIGDAKMGAVATRAYIQRRGDYYLMPLSLVQLSAALDMRLALVWQGPQPLVPVYAAWEPGQPREQLAEGFGWRETVHASVNETPVTWTERRRPRKKTCAPGWPKPKPPGWPSISAGVGIAAIPRSPRFKPPRRPFANTTTSRTCY